MTQKRHIFLRERLQTKIRLRESGIGHPDPRSQMPINLSAILLADKQALQLSAKKTLIRQKHVLSTVVFKGILFLQ